MFRSCRRSSSAKAVSASALKTLSLPVRLNAWRDRRVEPTLVCAGLYSETAAEAKANTSSSSSSSTSSLKRSYKDALIDAPMKTIYHHSSSSCSSSLSKESSPIILSPPDIVTTNRRIEFVSKPPTNITPSPEKVSFYEKTKWLSKHYVSVRGMKQKNGRAPSATQSIPQCEGHDAESKE